MHDITACHDNQIGTVAHLREGGGDPATVLQNREIAHQRTTVRVVHHRTDPIGQIERGAHAGHIRCQTTDHRLSGGAQDLGSAPHRHFKCGGATFDKCLPAIYGRAILEQRHAARAAVGGDLHQPGRNPHFQIVTDETAKGTGHGRVDNLVGLIGHRARFREWIDANPARGLTSYLTVHAQTVPSKKQKGSRRD